MKRPGACRARGLTACLPGFRFTHSVTAGCNLGRAERRPDRPHSQDARRVGGSIEIVGRVEHSEAHQRKQTLTADDAEVL